MGIKKKFLSQELIFNILLQNAIQKKQVREKGSEEEREREREIIQEGDFPSQLQNRSEHSLHHQQGRGDGAQLRMVPPWAVGWQVSPGELFARFFFLSSPLGSLARRHRLLALLMCAPGIPRIGLCQSTSPDAGLLSASSPVATTLQAP